MERRSVVLLSGGLDPDGFCATRATFYAALYPVLRDAARQCGYALPVHGSLTKDLDVVAVPWVQDATSPRELLRALVEAAGGFTVGSRSPRHHPKPHGRIAYTIHLGTTGGYVDVSIMPRRRTRKTAPKNPAGEVDCRDGEA